MSILLQNIHLTACNREHSCDLFIKDGKIAAVGQNLTCQADRIIDCKGKFLLPAFVDLHAHFRDPGFTHKEDILSGCKAAVKGGYTTVNLMPNTNPISSSLKTVDYVQDKAKQINLCDVFQTVSITEKFDGQTLSHLNNLEGRVRWITDDGFGVDSAKTILAAMKIAKEKEIGLMFHEEDSALAKTDSALAENLMTFRDVKLALLTGAKVHFSHVSTKDAVDYIVEGKKQGGDITCEVTPHHLVLNSDNSGRVNPPLRREEDRKYLISALKSGMIDAIATDHAPHTAEEKQAGANGFIGLESAFSLCYTHLVRTGHITLSHLSRLMSENPARLLGVNKGVIQPGFSADLVLVDLEKSFIITPEGIVSKSKNTPFMGETLYGEVVMTLKEGEVVYEKDN